MRLLSSGVSISILRPWHQPSKPGSYLFLCGLDEQEGGLVSFTLEIEPGGRDHMLSCMPSN